MDWQTYKSKVGGALLSGRAPRPTVAAALDIEPMSVIGEIGDAFDARLKALEGKSAGGCGCSKGKSGTKTVWADLGVIRYVRVTAAAGSNTVNVPLAGLNVRGNGRDKQGRARNIRIALLQDTGGNFGALTAVQPDDRSPDQNMPTGGIPRPLMLFDRQADVQYGYRYTGGRVEKDLKLTFEAGAPGDVFLAVFSADPAFIARANGAGSCEIGVFDDDYDGDDE